MTTGKDPIDLPASKSIGARFLVATYFAGTLPADPVFDGSVDLRMLQEALLNLYADEQPIDYGETPLDMGDSGTALRFVTAVCASTPGADFVVGGSPRLNRRPMQPLIDVLTRAGAIIEKQGKEGTGPYRVVGKRLEGGEFDIEAGISSQFISALMLASPTWKKGMKLNFSSKVASLPYIKMTAKVMSDFGIKVNLQDSFVEVNAMRYKDSGHFHVEPDWSAAAFFYEAAALGSVELFISGIVSPEKSMQGDSVADNYFKYAGFVNSAFTPEGVILKPAEKNIDKIELDFFNCPDLVPAMSVTCALSELPFRFTGVKNLRLKESDRLEAICSELAKLGYVVIAHEDSLEWKGDKIPCEEDAVIDPHDDHRIAMAFAFAAFKTGKIRIKNSEVVEKSFTGFWQEVDKTGLFCTLLEEGTMLIEKKNDTLY